MSLAIQSRSAAAPSKSISAIVGGQIPPTFIEALVAEYDRLNEICKRANAETWQVYELAKPHYPSRPKCLYGRRQDGDGNIVMFELEDWHVEDCRNNAEPIDSIWNKAYRNRRKAMDEYQAACDLVDAAHDAPRINEIARKAEEACSVVFDKIVAARVCTVRDIRAKLTWWARFNEWGHKPPPEDEIETRILAGITADFEAGIIDVTC